MTGPNQTNRNLKLEAFKVVKDYVSKGGLIEQRAIAKKHQQIPNPISPIRSETFNRKITQRMLLLFIVLSLLIYITIVAWRISFYKEAKRQALVRHRDMIERSERADNEYEKPILPSDASEIFDQVQVAQLKPKVVKPLFSYLIWIFPIIITVLSLLMFSSLNQDSLDYSYLSKFKDMAWLRPLLSGVLWSWFGIQVIRFVFPGIIGLEILHPSVVFSTLYAWCITSFVRCLIFLLTIIPLISFTHEATPNYTQSWGSLLNPVIPIILLALWCLIGILLDVISAYLDRQKVLNLASKENDWNHILHNYIQHWSEQQSDKPDLDNLSNVVFLAGKKKGIYVYGGGFSSTRVVIHEDLLNLAFSGSQPEHSLTSSSEQALDFLPAILINSLAQVHRSDHWIHCISILLKRITDRLPNKLQTFKSFINSYVWPLYSQYGFRIQDSFSCSQSCLDQTSQYLSYCIWQDDKDLTINADKDLLRKTTLRLIKKNQQASSNNLDGSIKSLRRRILWMGQIVHISKQYNQTEKRVSRYALMLMSLVLGFITFDRIYESYVYHDVYEHRVELQFERIQKRLDKWRKDKK